MDHERTADVLQVALASYDRKELRVQKNYLEEQNPVLACTCFLNGHKLLQELQQGHNFDIVVLCSQMEDMSSIEFMMELRKLEHKPLLMLFDEGRRKNSSALRMEDSGSCCCVERMELKNLLRELYRMPGQQWQRTEQQCQQLYHSWGIRIPDINCSYLTSAVGVVYGNPPADHRNILTQPGRIQRLGGRFAVCTHQTAGPQQHAAKIADHNDHGIGNVFMMQHL